MEKTMALHAPMRVLGAAGICAAIAVCVVCAAQTAIADPPAAGAEASPIYGVTMPAGYRDWQLISVGHLAGSSLDGSGGKLTQLRAQLGNDIAIKAMRAGTLPFPDGAIIAALHWNEVASDDNNKVLAGGFPGAGLQSSFAGSAVNVQFMVKDSKKYASTGGWGFADFKNGKPGNEALHKTCFPCHQPAKDRDFVFNHYTPAP